LLISTILLGDRVINIFLICKTSSILIFKAWVYDFLLLIDLDKEICTYNLLLTILLLFDLNKLEEAVRTLGAIMSFTTNWVDIHLWKDLLFLFTMSLFHSNS